MIESLLPYAPLTHGELNERVRDATLEAGYVARSLQAMYGDVPEHQVAALMQPAARAEEYAAAARRRMPQ